MTAIGDAAFGSMGKTSAEFFAMMYGSLVRQLISDNNATSASSMENVNKQLDDMGYNIGLRIIDEYLAKSKAPPCSGFQDTAEAIAVVGLKMFLGITANVTDVSEGAYTLEFDDSPLTLFVELPDKYRQQELHYCNILCGVIRGALSQVSIQTTVAFTADKLLGDAKNAIRVTSSRKSQS